MSLPRPYVVQTFRSALAGLKACTTSADALLSIVLAPSCAACESLLEHPTGGPVCVSCWRSILPIAQLSSPLVARAAAVGLHEGALRAVVHAIKYEGRRSLSKRLAFLMRERCGDVLDGAGAVVPVPLHASRRRARGFNQARDLARHLGLPVLRALKRTRATPSQTGLSAEERRRNVRGAFAPAWHAPGVSGLIVVLVDDVSTTGATIDACARVLLQMGAREVRAVTAARVVTPPQ
jgi:ComF family protein